jgi:hypothetical protein
MSVTTPEYVPKHFWKAFARSLKRHDRVSWDRTRRSIFYHSRADRGPRMFVRPSGRLRTAEVARGAVKRHLGSDHCRGGQASGQLVEGGYGEDIPEYRLSRALR